MQSVLARCVQDNDTVVGASDDRRARGVSGSAGVGTFTRRQHTAVDPTEVEEEVMKGRITFALTAHKEVSRGHLAWMLKYSPPHTNV